MHVYISGLQSSPRAKFMIKAWQKGMIGVKPVAISIPTSLDFLIHAHIEGNSTEDLLAGPRHLYNNYVCWEEHWDCDDGHQLQASHYYIELHARIPCGAIIVILEYCK